MAFPSRHEARTYVRISSTGKNAKVGKGKLKPYRCNICGEFHLTTMPKKVMKSKGYTL